MGAEGSSVVLRLSGVAASWGGQRVVEGIELEVRRGEIVALLGPSGSGKSTLLGVMTGLKRPELGSVEMFGRAVYGARGAEGLEGVRRRFGVVFQTGALFGSMSIGEGMASVLREHTALDEAVIAQVVRMKLALVGLGGMEGRRPAELSGGQRKRAAVARSTLLDPELLFCDEPSAGLDPVVAAGLDNVLLDLRRLFGTALVVITHELASVEAIADRVVMLHGGRVVAEGPVERLKRVEEGPVADFFARRAPPEGARGEAALGVLSRRQEGAG